MNRKTIPDKNGLLRLKLLLCGLSYPKLQQKIYEKKKFVFSCSSLKYKFSGERKWREGEYELVEEVLNGHIDEISDIYKKCFRLKKKECR